ncbi:hypothetical protein [Lactococcus fujiensis]|uniref:hypothetical protein n=1 Tax=Lactococcus fujiensis TaxID=610251 RepID=UPI0006CF9C46|nr:hypothetical protein [Lactococcus fujiensis]
MSELTIKDFKSKYEPIGLSMELKSQGQSAYETGKIGGHTPLYTDEQIQDYLSNQPQLTIPQSIADELDKYDFELTSKGLMYRNMGGTLVEFSRVTYDEIPQLIVQTIAGNYRIVFAYLAGKALGVDLVKVVEG